MRRRLLADGWYFSLSAKQWCSVSPIIGATYAGNICEAYEIMCNEQRKADSVTREIGE
jgi:hypothetical protein